MFARYIRTIALFLAPVLLLLTAMELGLRRIPNDYAYKHDQLLNHGADFRVLVLGSSHGYKGIDPEAMGLPGFNAANISQDLGYDRAILEHYLPHLPALEYLVLPISYGSLGARMAAGKEAWRVKNYTLYMGLDKDADALSDHLELLNRPMADQVRMLMKHYRTGRDNRACLPSGMASHQRRTGLDLDSTGRKAAARHFNHSQEAVEQGLADLDAILDLAAQHRLQVVLVTLPAWSTYRKELDPAQLERVQATCTRLAEASPTVHYLDLLNDPRFERTDFEDADHLSVSGATKASEIIAQLIGELPSRQASGGSE